MAALSAADAILAAVRAIPAGRVASYGEVARRAGLPRRARLVARTLATTEEEVPWHRVVRSDGRIAFPDGSRGFREQVTRLRAEGVTVSRGRVSGFPRGEAPETLDALLWGPAG